MRKTWLFSAGLCYLALCTDASADEFPRMDYAASRFNESQINDYHPVFDFDGDGCYPATPFNKYND
jgi:hypothetical protein